MLPKNLQNQIALGCYAIVADNFATFHNPKMRGPAFEWKNFPKMMESRCETSIFLNTPIPDKHHDAARAHASKTGLQIAKTLIHLMGEE